MDTEHVKARLTVVVKTFIRYITLRKTLHRIQTCWPGIPIIVVDDTPLHLREELDIPGVKFVRTEPDIGLSAGRNRGFLEAATEFVLYTDDDAHPSVDMTFGVLAQLLRRIEDGEADLIGWRGWKIEEPASGHTLKFKGVEVGEFTRVDVTENAYIARRSVLLSNPYNEKIKINGEHFSFFYMLKKAGVKVYASTWMNFRNTRTRSKVYDAYRNRNFRKAAHAWTGGFWGADWSPPPVSKKEDK